jgi:hypothetical protein
MLFGGAAMVYLEIKTEWVNGKREDVTSDAIKKIMLNFLQMVSLAVGLPLEWPKSCQAMFDFFATMGSAGTPMMVPDCELTSMHAADAFYAKQIGITLLVPIVICLCIFIWSCIRWCGCAKRFQMEEQLKDYNVLTVVLFLFLVWPTLVKFTLSTMKCTEVGTGTLYLIADLQEQCFVGRHLRYLLLLTLPQLFVYVLGLPLCATLLIIRNNDRLKDRTFITRYGLLYMGFRENREWWEVVIALRKFLIVAISTFGTMMGVVYLPGFVALVVVFLSVVVHLIGRPFDTTETKTRLLHDLEFAALTVCWFTFWGGLLFYLGHENSGSISEEVVTSTTVLLVSINVLFVLSSIFIYFREFKLEKKVAKRRLTEVLPVLKDTNLPEQRYAGYSEEGNEESALKNWE